MRLRRGFGAKHSTDEMRQKFEPVPGYAPTEWGTVLLRAAILGMDGVHYVALRGTVARSFAKVVVSGPTQEYELDRDQMRGFVRHGADVVTPHPRLLVVP